MNDSHRESAGIEVSGIMRLISVGLVKGNLPQPQHRVVRVVATAYGQQQQGEMTLVIVLNWNLHDV